MPSRKQLDERFPTTEVSEFYEDSASAYSEMMDSEIDLPIYADILSRLAKRISALQGPVVDTSCGSGHMLARYHEEFDQSHPLVGVDLSPKMTTIAKARLSNDASVLIGDMRDLHPIKRESSSALLSFFAIHHLDTKDLVKAFNEWNRVLRPGGQLLIAAWEGEGAIDYGEHSEIVALRYSPSAISNWVREAGFVVDKCTVEPVEGIPMKAIYLEATRQ